jgi:hypothetical protein
MLLGGSTKTKSQSGCRRYSRLCLQCSETLSFHTPNRRRGDVVLATVIAALILATKKMQATVANGAAVQKFTNTIGRVHENEITEWLQTLQQAVPPM